MKSLLSHFLVAFCLLSAPVYSQHVLNNTPAYATNDLAQKILKKQQGRLHHVAARGNALEERLTGFTTKNLSSSTTIESSDSAKYNYGSVVHPSFLDNNDVNSYTETIYGFGGIWTIPHLRIIDRPSIGFEKAYYVFDRFASGIHFEYRILRNYNTNGLLKHQENKIKGSEFPIWQHATDLYDYAYNADSQLTYAEYTPYHLSMSDNAGASFKIYSSGNLVKDSIADIHYQTPRPKTVNDYTYDQAGNLSSASRRWYEYGYQGSIVTRDSYFYNSNNLLIAHQYEGRNNSADSLYASMLDSFFYTGNELTKSVSYGRQQSTDPLTNYGYAFYYNHYDAHGNVDSALKGTMSATGFIPYFKTISSYTAADHYDQINYYSNNNGVLNSYPDTRLKFYYESVSPTTVQSVSNSIATAIIYPNPTNSHLFIKFKIPPNAAVGISIYNITGQLVKSATLANQVNELSLESLSTGAYFVHLKDGDSIEQYQFLKN